MAKSKPQPKQKANDLAQKPALVKKKNPWTTGLALRDFFQFSPRQQSYVDAYDSEKLITCALGSAGTGKTSLAAYLALCDLMDKGHPCSHVRFIRSVVPVREMGYLKGSQEEKEEVYNIYRNIVNDAFGRGDAWDILEFNGFVSFCSTSFEQGKTYENTSVVLDEIGNMNFKEIDLIVSRLGFNSRIQLLGDLNQSYLNSRKEDECGVKQFFEIVKHMDISHIEYFTGEDIVRADLVRDYICMRDHVLHGEPLPSNYGSRNA